MSTRSFGIVSTGCIALVLVGIWSIARRPRVDLTRDTAISTESVPSDGRRELAFEPPIADLGALREPTDHTFKVINRSERPVSVLSVGVSCSCLLVHVPKGEIAPGASDTVTVRVDPQRVRVGPQSYVIDVTYEGSNRHTERLELRFVNRPEVEVPEMVHLRSVPGKPAGGIFTVTDHRESALRILGVTTSAASLKARLVESPTSYTGGWRYRIGVDFEAEDVAPGTYNGVVTLNTDDPKRQSIAVPVTVVRSTRTRVIPETLHLKDSNEPGGPFTGTLHVSDPDGGQVTIDKIESSPGSLRCQTLGQPNATHLIGVSCDSVLDLASPLTVRLTVSRPVAETIVIRVLLPHRSP